MQAIRTILALVVLATIGLAQTTYFVDSRASGFGAGTPQRPFNSPQNLGIQWGEEAVVLIAAGSEFTLTGSWLIGPNTRVGVYDRSNYRRFTPTLAERPVLKGDDAAIYGLVRLEDAFDVLIEDLILERARHGFYAEGSMTNVTVRRVLCRDMYGLGGFAHEDGTEGNGQIWFDQCDVQAVEGDGFSNRGSAQTLITNSRAVHCGPIWGRYELDFRIPVETDLVRYTSVSTTRPTILRNIYVDSVGGDDSNDGLSPASPWQTPSKINSSSAIGDRIHLKRESVFTATIQAKTDQEFTTYGSGRRPAIFTSSTDGILLNDVSRVFIKDLLFRGAPGIEVDGDVEDIWVVDCLFDRCGTFGIETTDAAGTGDVNIFGCGFHWTDDGSVFAQDGAYVVSAWNCRGHDNGRAIGSSAAAAWAIADEASLYLYNVQEDDPHYRGVSLAGTGDALIFGCWFNDPQDNAGVTVRKGIEVTGTGTYEIANTVIGMPDPGSGETTIGIHTVDASGTTKVYNCTLQDSRDSGGNGSSLVTVGQTDGFDMQNCILENPNGSASSYYVTLDADATNEYTISHNWYHDWSGDSSLDGWRDDGGTAADMDLATWQAVDGVVEDTEAGGIVTTQLTTTLPATVAHYEARIEDASSAIHWLGKDLQAASLVTWTTDAGLRTRGRGPSGAWMPGAWINSTGAPDGATTHQVGSLGSTMRIEDSKFLWCHHAFGFTHDQATTEDEMALLRNEIRYSYHQTFQTLITRPFPIRDNLFYQCEGSAIEINAPASVSASDVWEITGNHIYNTGGVSAVSFSTQDAGTTFNFSSNVLQMAEATWWPRPSESMANGILLGGSATLTANIDNNAIWMPFNRYGFGLTYCVRCTLSGTTMNVNNNVMYTPDDSNAIYTRIANLNNIGTWDDNFYWENTTNGDNWHNATTNVAFATWQAVSGTPDANGWEDDQQIAAHPVPGDERFMPAEAWRVSRGATQYSAGTDRSAVTRWAMGGGVRPDSGAWSLGPFVADIATDAIFRSDQRLIFSEFITASTTPYTDIPIRLFDESFQPSRRMVIESICLFEFAGNPVNFQIHEGIQSHGRVIFAGGVSSGSSVWMKEDLRPSIGQNLYISFSEAGSTISGYIKYRWEEIRNAEEDRKVPAPRIGGPVR